MDPNNSARTILLADDDQFVSVVYKEGLEHAGYRVELAGDGQKAMDILQTNPPDIVVLDLILPKVNGFDVLKSIRNNPLLTSLPVIVLTDLSQEDDKKEAESYGIKAFLTKADTSLADLLNCLDGLKSA